MSDQATQIPSDSPAQRMMPGVGQVAPEQKQATPLTVEQVDAAAAAEMADFVTGAVNDEAPPEKPTKLPDEARSVEEDNARAEPALQVDDEEEDLRTDEEKAADPAKPKGKKTVGQRIAEMTRQRGDEARRADAAEARAAALEERLERLERGEPAEPKTPAPAKAAAEETGRPKAPEAAKFKYGEFDPELSKAKDVYTEDLAEWKAEQALSKRDRAAAAQREQDAQAQRVAEVTAQRDVMAERGVAEFGDAFMTDVIQAAIDNKFPVSPTVARLTFASEAGHMVAHLLATDPKTAREVYGKSPEAQAAWFGRQEERFLTAKAAKTPSRQPKVPDLPTPPRHQARGVGGQFSVSADTTDFEQFEAMAEQQQRK